MVYRLFVERKPGFALEADALRGELGLAAVERIRIYNRYDAENLPQALFEQARSTVFSDPCTDMCFSALPEADCFRLAVEYLPGQYDQRADAAEQCLQLIAQGERPTVRTARIYDFYGALSDADRAAVETHLINPVECRKARLAPYDTLQTAYPEPEPVELLDGFSAMSPAGIRRRFGLAMDENDVKLIQEYFAAEGRCPTLTELKVLDTYWSDHCRHTTFLTELDTVSFLDPAAQATFQTYLEMRRELGAQKPVTLMDLATVGAKYLRAKGGLSELDGSKENNACTIRISVDRDGTEEPWLLLFKNETHNHPTEIEPFGGAATCLGGAIRDPLSGRAYVYQAMRISGAADPRPGKTPGLTGKLSQRRIVTSAANGYSSYGNQIGLATGLVEELYHPGYLAKHMEIGAVVGAVPRKNVRQEEPAPGDAVLLIGGKTGRDGCGGATGSSKAHGEASLATCGSEVQKGNAPEERKLQRLFRNPQATRLIKRCNDFGAGGVCVAIGELADGLTVDLDRVPRKYQGLDGTELAISESQERMAAVVAAADAKRLIALAAEENLLAVQVAEVTREPRLVMHWRGQTVVDLSRAFIDSNGAKRSAAVLVEKPGACQTPARDPVSLARDLNICIKRGLSERFDSTVGANTVLMPFGGRRQMTPAQAMGARIPVEQGETDTCSVMSYGYDPALSEASPYRGAYLAVVESVAKLIAAGASRKGTYLTFQEYFEKPFSNPASWGKPTAALLGALQAQLDLSVGAIGGKDSMSGTFEQLHVPPTLVSFAISVTKAQRILSPEFKRAGSRVILLEPEYGDDGLPKKGSLPAVFDQAEALLKSGRVLAAWALTRGGMAEGVMKMCMGNGLGFRFTTDKDLYQNRRGGFLLELTGDVPQGETVGFTTEEARLVFPEKTYALSELEEALTAPLESVYPTKPKEWDSALPASISFSAAGRLHARTKAAGPRVLIPVFPGTNCEYESARQAELAGAKPQVLVLNTLSPEQIRQSVRRFAALLRKSQILFLPGGFSGGDEPDGSGRFITAFLRSEAIREEIGNLLENRDGLILGICNGFQALIKLGLVPFGRITAPDSHAPTLTYNTVGRHQSRLARVRIASNKSPWMLETRPGELFLNPVSHGEGRFVCEPEVFQKLVQNGQILSQYADETGSPTMDPLYNPNGSYMAVEGITSPDGRVLGKMAHSERIGENLYKNVPGKKDMGLFRSAVRYFS